MQADAHRRKQTAQHAGAYYALSVFTLMELLSTAETHLSPMKVLVQEEFHLSDFQTTLPNIMEKIVTLVLPLIFGWLGDSGLVDRRTLFFAMSILWSSVSSLTLLCPSFGMLCAIRFCVAIGQSSISVCTIPLLAEFFSSDARVYAFSLISFAEALGGTLGMIMSSQIAPAYGWRTTYGAISLPALLASVSIFFIPEPPKYSEASGKHCLANKHDVLNSFGFILSHGYFWLPLFASVATSIAFEGTVDWYATFLIRYHEFSIGNAGILMAIASFSGGVFGALLGAPVTAQLRRIVRNAESMALGGISSSCAVFLFVALIVFNDGFVLNAIVASLFMVTHFAQLAPTDTLLTNVMPAQSLGLSFALRGTISTVLAGHGAGMTGAISDMSGSLRIGMLFLVVIELLAALIWWCAYYILPATSDDIFEVRSERQLLDSKSDHLCTTAGNYGSMCSANQI